jgi:outer membrane protein assembly factor BamB
MRSVRIVLVLGVMAVTRDASAWLVHEVPVPFTSAAHFAVVAPGGDAFLVVNGDQFIGPRAVRLNGETGAERFRREIPVSPPGGGGAAALALRGDTVFMGGTLRPGGWITAALVAIDANTGAERWRHTFQGAGALALNLVHDLAVDPAGDVIGVGEIYEDGESTEFVVVKVDGETGAERWFHRLVGVPFLNDAANTVAVDSAGHVTAAGYSTDADGRFHLAVVQLDGTTGDERWRRTDVLGQAFTIAVDAAGDVVVGGTIGDYFVEVAPGVTKLDGETGADVWTHLVSPAVAGAIDAVPSLELTADGDVLAVSQVGYVSFDPDGRVVRLDGGTGAVEWQHDVEGLLARRVALGGDGAVGVTGQRFGSFAVLLLDASTGVAGSLTRVLPGEGEDLVFDASGAVVAAGYGGFVLPEGLAFVPVVAKFSETVAGDALRMRDAGSGAGLRIALGDPSILPNGPGDDGDPTVAGATLTIRNPVSGEVATVDLPASGWRARRSRRPGSGAYAFRGPGPCRWARLETGVLRVRCAGPVGFSLNEAAQGRIAIRLDVPGGQRWCAEFGGSVGADRAGSFASTAAPAPPSCD